jgi:hypothetical protein
MTWGFAWIEVATDVLLSYLLMSRELAALLS